MNKFYGAAIIILLSAVHSLPARAAEIPEVFDSGLAEVSETMPSVEGEAELYEENDPVVDSSEGVLEGSNEETPVTVLDDETPVEPEMVIETEAVEEIEEIVESEETLELNTESEPSLDPSMLGVEAESEDEQPSSQTENSDEEPSSDVEVEQPSSEVEIAGTTNEPDPIPEGVPALDLPKIIISEINWAGSTLSTADEWIELYNDSSVDVDLSGWVLTGSATKGDALALADGTIMKAYSTILISNYAFGHEKTTLNVEPDLVTSSLSLPNSKLNILLTTPDGVVVDEVSFSGKASAGSSDPVTSMEWNQDSMEWEDATKSTNLLDSTQFGTPGKTTYSNVSASSPTSLILNEVVSDPIDGIEWIEIFNSGDEAVVVDEWSIKDATEKATILYGTIEPNQFLVIENPKGQLNNGGDLVELVNQNNQVVDSLLYGTDVPAPSKGESLIFENGEWVITTSLTKGEVNVMSTEVEEVTEEAESEDEQPSSQAESEDEQPSSQDTSEQPSSETKIEGELEEVNTVESTEDVSYESGALIITEFVSNPEDGVEWIEISNPGDSTINLAGWSIADATEKTTALEGTIEPGGQFVIENPKGQLNNGEDVIILFDGTGSIIDSLEYGGDIPAPNKGESTSLENGTWLITTSPTKGETNQPIYETTTKITTSEATNTSFVENDYRNEPETVQNSNEKREGDDLNISTEPETHRVVAIAESTKVQKIKAPITKSKSKSKSKSKAVSKRVSRSGIITAVPGTFGSQIAFIDDLQLYFYYADWPKLEIGDMVTITGEMSEARGEERIKISSADDIKITGHQEMTPQELSMAQVLNSPLGTLVKTTGEVIEKNGDKLIIESNGLQLTVVANSREGMSWSSLQSGVITVTGVIRHINGETRLYLRSSDDIEEHFAEVIEEEEETHSEIIAGVTRSNNITPWLGGGMLAGTLLALAYWFLKTKTLSLNPKTN